MLLISAWPRTHKGRAQVPEGAPGVELARGT